VTSQPGTAAAPTPTPVATTAPGSAAPAGAIPDGTYVSGTVQVADMVATVNADKQLTAAQLAQINKDFEFGDHRTSVIKIDLHGGRWTQSGSYDGSPFQVGSRATYASPDASTVVIQEQCCGLTTFQVTMTGTTFTLKRLSGTQNTELDKVEGHILFEETPFTLVP
jgi:hypothetical protein